MYPKMNAEALSVHFLAFWRLRRSTRAGAVGRLCRRRMPTAWDHRRDGRRDGRRDRGRDGRPECRRDDRADYRRDHRWLPRRIEVKLVEGCPNRSCIGGQRRTFNAATRNEDPKANRADGANRSPRIEVIACEVASDAGPPTIGRTRARQKTGCTESVRRSALDLSMAVTEPPEERTKKIAKS